MSLQFKEQMLEYTGKHSFTASLLTFIREYITEFRYFDPIQSCYYKFEETSNEERKELNQTDDIHSKEKSLPDGDKRKSSDLHESTNKKTENDSYAEETMLYERDPKADDSNTNLDMSAEGWLKIPFAAIEQNRMDILEMCIKSGVDLNLLRSPLDYDLLMYAVGLPNVDDQILHILMKYFDPCSITNRGKTAVNICITNEALSAERKLCYVKLLAEGGHFENFSRHKHAFWESALHSYIFSLFQMTTANEMKYWKQFIDIFLMAGNDINQKQFMGQTPLMLAVQCVQSVENDVVDMDKEIFNEMTLLREEKKALIRYLLQRGANPNCSDYVGRTCAHLVVNTDNLDVLVILVEGGCKFSVQCLMKMTCVYWLCCRAVAQDDEYITDVFTPMLKILVEAGCSLNARAIDQSTALHFTAAKGSRQVCEQLILLGSDVNAKDYLKRTPLHMAARNQDPKVIEFFIELGGNINATDIHSDTPLHIACMYNNLEVVKVLLKREANVSAISDLGIQPIHLTAENGSVELIECLAPLVSIDAIDQWNASPLHYAASDGNIEIVSYLLDIGANKSAIDSQGLIPYNMATYRGYLKVAELLSLNNDAVKFGHLPSGLFPNRPLIDEDKMDNYFNNLTKSFLDYGKCGVEVARFILESPGLGHVNLECNEAKIISERITEIAHRLANRIGEIEPLFRCRLIRAGSTAEDSKVGYPDEFDFLCCIDGFTDFIERIEHGEESEFVKIVMKESAPERILEYCINKPRVLNASKVFRQFAILGTIAIYDVLSEGFSQIYSGHTLLTDLIPRFTHSELFMGNLLSLKFSFRGQFHKILDVTVDFNPVVYESKVPEQMKEYELLPSMKEMGMYYIPKFLQKFSLQKTTPDHIFPETTDLWRYSTHHFECAIFSALPKIGKECYMLCKIFRMEPLTCNLKSTLCVQDGDFDSQTISEEEGSEDGSTCISDGLQNMSSSETKEGSIKGSPHMSDEIQNLSSDDNSDVISIQEEENPFTLDYEDDGEIKAVLVIPTFYIKTIFLQEAEKMYKTSKRFDEKTLTVLPRRVYEELFRALENNCLKSVFFSSYNIKQRTPDKTVYDSDRLVTIQKKYCKHIIDFMDKLGFKDDESI